MGQSRESNGNLESLVENQNNGSKTVIYSQQYGPFIRIDKPKPFPTEGPRIEPGSFYGRATFEDIANYFVVDKYFKI